MRLLPDNLFPVGSPLALPDTLVDRIPQGRAWLRGLALNPTAPGAVRRRLAACDPAVAASFPEQAVSIRDLLDLAATRSDRDTRGAALLTSVPPEDLDDALDRTGAVEVRFRYAMDEETRTDTEKWLRGEKILKWRKGRLVSEEPTRWSATARRTAVLQEMYATSGIRDWRRIAEHPWFVSHIGLARFADHKYAFTRLAAAEDPAVPGPVLAGLLTDPSPTLRWWARRDPRLPWPYLRPLLDHHPEDAAANPGLPVEVMHRLLDIVGVREA
ncbi:hypothetical protein [Yinghuangia sp. YIM S09857]|uniref:hypothetical protein n=1 Tax=Yinghuangia sp. YIM S09857 TaxID=3436929 RepID=UPI003F536A90